MIGRQDLIKSARTEPEALLRGARSARQEGMVELSRERVTCDMIGVSASHDVIDASRSRGRIAKHIDMQLGCLVDANCFDITFADSVARTLPRGRGVSLSMANALPRIPRAPTIG